MPPTLLLIPTSLAQEAVDLVSGCRTAEEACRTVSHAAACMLSPCLAAHGST